MASNRMSPEEANARALAGEPIIFVDSRKPLAWKKSDQKIPQAIRMRADEVALRANELDRNATIITYCT
ncbi:MAG: hypothetical protein HY646_12800 [Acidobacteria bacterium]|nr:hypothetical protein [Acidobacteriota bacterium]